MNQSISRKARIETGVRIGNGTVIEDDVHIRTGTTIGRHVIIHNGSVIGENNRVHSGVHIGVEPQDYHFRGEYSRCIIGNNNTIREYTTVSRATGEHQETIIGDDNFIMTYVHIAHNDTIGSHTIIASGVQIGGYVTIGDHVNIGGLSGVHQFCQIGDHAMLGAVSYLNQDLMPYLLAHGNRARLYGVNVRGLARGGYGREGIEKIKNLFRPLLQFRVCLDIWLSRLDQADVSDQVKVLINDFIKQSKRGILIRTKKL